MLSVNIIQNVYWIVRAVVSFYRLFGLTNLLKLFQNMIFYWNEAISEFTKWTAGLYFTMIRLILQFPAVICDSTNWTI